MSEVLNNNLLNNSTLRFNQKEFIINYFNGKTGLKNLGNSCYMNSALQCIVHCKEIFDQFLSLDTVSHYKKIVKLRETVNKKKNNETASDNSSDLDIYKYNLLESFVDFIKEVWYYPEDLSNKQDKNGNEIIRVLDPIKIKENFVKIYSEFDNKLQHDCHEFITYFLDSLHQALNRVDNKNNVIAEDISHHIVNPKLNFSKTLSSIYLSSHKKFNDSVIVDLFYGQLKSTISCCQCNEDRIVFDPFSSLGLSIPLEFKMFVYIVKSNQKSYKILLDLNEELHYYQVKRKIESYFEERINNYIFYFVCNNTVNRIIFDNAEKLGDLKQRNGFLFCYYQKENNISNKTNLSMSDYYGENTNLSFSLNKSNTNDNSDRNSNDNKMKLFPASLRKKSEGTILQESANFVYLNLEYTIEKSNINSSNNNNFNQSHCIHDSISKKSSNSQSLNNKNIIKSGVNTITNSKKASKIEKTCKKVSNEEHNIQVEKISYPRVIRFKDTENISSLTKFLEEEAVKYSTNAEYKILVVNSNSIINSCNASCVDTCKDNNITSHEQTFANTKEVNNCINYENCNFCLSYSAFCSCLFSYERSSVQLKKIFNANNEINNNKDSDGVNQNYRVINIYIVYQNKYCVSLETINVSYDLTFKPMKKRELDIYNLLDFFTSEEEVPNYYCEFCNSEVKAKRKLEINRIPKILVIQLKRFYFRIESTNRFNKKIKKAIPKIIEEKNDNTINFHPRLNVSKYLTIHKTSGNVSNETNAETHYNLFGVCNHIGNTNSGHYTALAKHHISQEWFEFDDKQVKKYSNDIVTKNAYLLFYSKAD